MGYNVNMGDSGTSGNLWHTNSPVSPSIYACYAHGEHEAECFVAFDTSEGREAIPVCYGVVEAVVAELSEAAGIKYVSPNPLDSFTGQISGSALTT